MAQDGRGGVRSPGLCVRHAAIVVFMVPGLDRPTAHRRAFDALASGIRSKLGRLLATEGGGAEDVHDAIEADFEQSQRLVERSISGAPASVSTIMSVSILAGAAGARGAVDGLRGGAGRLVGDH